MPRLGYSTLPGPRADRTDVPESTPGLTGAGDVMLVPMTLARIVIVDSDEEKMSMIVLQEQNGERAFPILIGIHEAYAIDRRTKGVVVPRPLTHDLIERLMERLECRLERIVISELRDSTFYAKLVLRKNGEMIELDSRPSDAIAIGAGTEVPILVEESVLREVC
jgi:bifunctional DNase/RNase